MKRIYILSLISIATLCGCAEKLQVCPDAWIENRMPGTGSSTPSEYLIIDGERRELNEFDLDWIEENCSVQKQIVH